MRPSLSRNFVAQLSEAEKDIKHLSEELVTSDEQAGQIHQDDGQGGEELDELGIPYL